MKRVRTLRALRGNAPLSAAKAHGPPEWGLDDLVYRPPSTPAWEEAWDITEQLVLAIDEETRAMGARLLVVTLTNPEQMDPDPASRAAYMKRLGVDDLTYPDSRIERFCDEHGIAAEALAPPMLEYAQANNLFLHGFENTRLGAAIGIGPDISWWLS